MKRAILFSLALFGLSALAQNAVPPMIRYQSAAPCDFWSYQQGGTGGIGGYVCSSYPMRMSIAEATSVQSAVESLHQRIRELESKVRDLEEAARLK